MIKQLGKNVLSLKFPLVVSSVRNQHNSLSSYAELLFKHYFLVPIQQDFNLYLIK